MTKALLVITSVIMLIFSTYCLWPTGNPIKLRLVTEFEPTASVLISGHLFGDNTPAQPLVAALKATGVAVMILQDPNANAADGDLLTSLQTEGPAMDTPQTDSQEASPADDDGSNTAHLANPKRQGTGQEPLDADEPLSPILPVAHDSFWIRDFGPVVASMPVAGRQQHTTLVDFTFRAQEELNDSLPYQLAMMGNYSVIHIPIKNDGGNFLTNGSTCLLTATYELPEGQPPLANLLATIGCQQTLIFADFPHEHIDMWAKFISRDTILVNQFHLPPQPSQEQRRQAKALEAAAAQLAAHFTVVRLPMPPPQEDLFQTYANGLLVNQFAILPTFLGNAAMETSVANIFKAHGFTVKWVPGDYLAQSGGSIHCVTLAFPDTITVPFAASH